MTGQPLTVCVHPNSRSPVQREDALGDDNHAPAGKSFTVPISQPNADGNKIAI